VSERLRGSSLAQNAALPPVPAGGYQPRRVPGKTSTTKSDAELLEYGAGPSYAFTIHHLRFTALAQPNSAVACVLIVV
jgi:hypothetical protein